MIRRNLDKTIEKLEDELSDLILERNHRQVKLEKLDDIIQELVDEGEMVLPHMERDYNRIERSIRRIDTKISAIEDNLEDLKDAQVLGTKDFSKMVREITKAQEERMEQHAEEDEEFTVLDERKRIHDEQTTTSVRTRGQASEAFLAKFKQKGSGERPKRRDPKIKSTKSYRSSERESVKE